MEDSENIELNENQNCHYNKHTDECYNEKETNNHTLNRSTPDRSSQPPTASSSASSISSDSCSSFAQQIPQPQYYPPYAYAYPYPWCPPQPPANGEHNATVWPYVYPMPFPQPVQPADCSNNSSIANYPPYPFPYPYYPTQFPIPSQNPSSSSSQGFDASSAHDQKAFYPYLPPPPPYFSYPYPVPPTYTLSPSSSSASSVLPDIIITPSTDDVPSQIIMQHHVKMEKPQVSRNSVEIQEIASNTEKLNKVEGTVINVLNKAWDYSSVASDTNLNLAGDIEKHYVGECKKHFDVNSPIENLSPVLKKKTTNRTIIYEHSPYSSDSESSTDDSEITPICTENKFGLQAIKSVSNIQIYNGVKTKIPIDEDDSDITTIDGESDVFDDEEDIENEKDLVFDDQNDEQDDPSSYIETEELSVIYEESDIEQSFKIKEDSYTSHGLTTNNKPQENIDHEEDAEEDSTSVTGRLPLKLSFRRSSNYENITTVEVGNSEIKEEVDEHLKPVSPLSTWKDENTDYSLGTEKQNLFPYIKLNSEHLSLICDKNSVSVAQNMDGKTLQPTEKQDEDLDFFATLRATKMQTQKIMEQSANYWGKPNEKKTNAIKTQNIQNSVEEFVNEAIEIGEKKVDTDSRPQSTCEKPSDKKKALEDAKQSFWSSVAAAEQKTETKSEAEVEVDFWAIIEDAKENGHWIPKNKTVTCSTLEQEHMEEVEFSTRLFKMQVQNLPQLQTADISMPLVTQPQIKSFEQLRLSSMRDEKDKPKEKKTDQTSEEIEDFVDDESDESEVEEDKPMELYKRYDVKEEDNYKAEEEETYDETEVDFWAEIEKTKETQPFDFTQYPEEPREVDTDEEIDFWAEIEAKRQDDDGEVNFYKSASFWASREKETSVQPVLPKTFTEQISDDIWEKLEAAKGEEPSFIDPDIEIETQANCQATEDVSQYIRNEWDQEQDSAKAQKITETHFWNQNEAEEEQEQVNSDDDKEREELDVKRTNYRKAMAFFTTPIDEHRDKSEESCTKSRKSMNKESPQNDVMNETQLCVEDSEANERNSYEDLIEDRLADDRNATPTNCDSQSLEDISKMTEVYVEPILKNNILENGLSDLNIKKCYEDRKISVRDRICAFESGSVEKTDDKKLDIKSQNLLVESYTPKSNLSRNNSSQRSESEIEEDDSGVTDMNRQLSETDTESESFPELRKMTSYQRAATHSRLFKLLQDDDLIDIHDKEGQQVPDEYQLRPSRRKIIHNVSITRKQNPTAFNEAESMTKRRERLSLPLHNNKSIDADNPSTPNSPASPILGNPANSRIVSDKLVNELVQSLLLKSDSTHLRHLPMDKLQAAAKRALEEELDSLENTSVETTPALTPNDHKSDKSYTEYYASWSDATSGNGILPSKAFQSLQEQALRRNNAWSVRCPRVLSSKTINRDLARVTESPEIATRTSKSPECFSRESSLNRWKKT